MFLGLSQNKSLQTLPLQSLSRLLVTLIIAVQATDTAFPRDRQTDRQTER
jgi:hypothetical protein